ncbi:uncharacterized protein LOC116404077 [Cucumis sativus]|uniref:Uncharacterized protein n=1 Tax=Cucumis sativus TaxID=3659 RepID=A0A0A0KQC1_CUCSA|nr:uncharacterized protein LOC116404077 [Cucumis sativus]KGN51054.1 hypothetical protein Csa_008327 [Cucumis sativus]
MQIGFTCMVKRGEGRAYRFSSNERRLARDFIKVMLARKAARKAITMRLDCEWKRGFSWRLEVERKKTGSSSMSVQGPMMRLAIGRRCTNGRRRGFAVAVLGFERRRKRRGVFEGKEENKCLIKIKIMKRNFKKKEIQEEKKWTKQEKLGLKTTISFIWRPPFRLT